MISTVEHLFLAGMDAMQKEIGEDMEKSGFADPEIRKNPLYVPTKLALITTEVAEAIEGHRRGNPPDDHLPNRDTVSCELADIVIRALDLAYQLDIPLGEVIVEKRRYNTGRPRKHNKLY